MRFAVLAVALLGLTACREQTAPANFGSVPDFILTGENGAEFSSQSLKGKVWVADFIYTTCQGPCPRMSSQMRQIQNATAKWPGLLLVSFTVDPEHDTPPVLAAYAKRFQADPARWHFLTGPRETLQLLSRESFKLGDVGGKLEHSTRFVLVDRKARIRGYYNTWEADNIRKLLSDIRIVLKETA